MKKTSLSAIAVFLFSIGLAQTVNPPPQKEGLWSMHKQTIDNPGNVKTESTQTICHSHEYDKYVLDLAKKVPGCKVLNETLSSGKYAIEMQCNVAGTVIKTTGTTTFHGDTAAHSESRTTYSPAFYGKTETTMIDDAKYVGACPAGTQPGDIMDADGKKINTWKH